MDLLSNETRNYIYLRVVVKESLGSLSVMSVEVYDENALDTQIVDSMFGRYCDVVAETESWGQCHQHFMSSFCANILAPKYYKAKLEIEKGFAKHFCTKKVSHKMLMKLTPLNSFVMAW